MEELSAGDVFREHFPQPISDNVNLYLGSGRCGACFDAWGLMNNGARCTPLESISNTVLMHADHWHRGAWGLDYWLPVGRLMFAGETPAEPKRYQQVLRLVQGYLFTELEWPGLKQTQVAYFNPARRDVLAFHISYDALAKARPADLLLSPETNIETHYKQQVTGSFELLESGSGFWVARVKAGGADSVLALRVVSNQGSVEIHNSPEGARLKFSGKRGAHMLLIGTAAYSRRNELLDELKSIGSAEDSLEEAIAAWQKRWGDADIEIPVTEYQALWERSVYYMLASSAPEVRSPPAPMGWSGNAWPFHFPQDVSYMHPALLRLGHLDIVKAWVEYYRASLENMRRVTQRIYKSDGVMWPWEFPIGKDSELLKDGTPNWFQYEIHNAAYPARMAYDAWRFTRDEKWAREFAWPVVLESARFYASTLQREDDGTWGVHIMPSMGQDEMGGKNAKNYLCALFSARYCLQTALAMKDEIDESIPDAEQWRAILKNGLAFPRLFDKEQGIYATCEGLLGKTQVGKQKHPVQLNPLTFLPLGEAEPQTMRAYELRQNLCAGVSDNVYHGWTLGAYWLAASHSRDPAGLAHELGQTLPARYVDPDWIQIYESSALRTHPYYMTSHGLYVQAVNDALVSDYFGTTEIGAACPKEWDDVAFTSLRSADGRVLSGERQCDAWKVEEEK